MSRRAVPCLCGAGGDPGRDRHPIPACAAPVRCASSPRPRRARRRWCTSCGQAPYKRRQMAFCLQLGTVRASPRATANLPILHGFFVSATGKRAARLLPQPTLSRPVATDYVDSQERRKDGSDGTRTRDLRRDRPLRGSRRSTTMGAQTLDSCGLSRSSRLASAWLSQAVFMRLLPVCCP